MVVNTSKVGSLRYLEREGALFRVVRDGLLFLCPHRGRDAWKVTDEPTWEPTICFSTTWKYFSGAVLCLHKESSVCVCVVACTGMSEESSKLQCSVHGRTLPQVQPQTLGTINDPNLQIPINSIPRPRVQPQTLGTTTQKTLTHPRVQPQTLGTTTRTFKYQ